MKDVNYNMIFEVKEGPAKETQKVKSGDRIVRVGVRDTRKVSKDQVIKYLKEAGKNFVMVVCKPVKLNQRRLPKWSMAEQAVEITKTAMDSNLEFTITNFHDVCTF